MSDPTTVATADQEVLITRIFDAPRERVFRAWTDPDEVAAWYGPESFDTPRERIHIDLRVGGRYELTMVHRTRCRRSACTSLRSRASSCTTSAAERA